MTMRLVRSKLRKREESSSSSGSLEAAQVIPSSEQHQQQQQPPAAIAYRQSPASVWVFPPLPPQPNIFCTNSQVSVDRPEHSISFSHTHHFGFYTFYHHIITIITQRKRNLQKVGVHLKSFTLVWYSPPYGDIPFTCYIVDTWCLSNPRTQAVWDIHLHASSAL